MSRPSVHRPRESLAAVVVKEVSFRSCGSSPHTPPQASLEREAGRINIHVGERLLRASKS